MDRLQIAHDALLLLWRSQFRLPEPLWWLVLVFVSPALTVEASAAALAFGAPWALALGGALRWHWHRGQSRRGLAVARFSALRGSGRPEQVQQVVLTSLQDKLPPAELSLVHGLPTLVGTHDRSFAVRLRRRLRARFLLYGRIDEQGDDYAVFARVVQPVDRGVTHLDWYTRDVTPARARWGPLIQLLTPSLTVDVAEYPLEFTGELEAVVRGTGGQVAADVGDWQRAEELLRYAISVAATSTSHQVDRLRADLAGAVRAQGRRDEALAILRDRASGEHPSPYLLRRLIEILGPQRGDITPTWDPEDRKEAIAALRLAAKDEADPQRDLTLYNLLQLIGGPGSEEEGQESDGIREYLMANSRYYRGTWYLRREVGAVHFHRATAASADGNHRAARHEYRRAARWYARAIRARPRFRFMDVRGPQVVFFNRYRQSAVLLANAWDARRNGRQPLRAIWYYRRFRREQRRLARLGTKFFQRGDWQAAEAYFDWGTVGYRDSVEAKFWFFKAVCLKQLGHDTEADDAWATAYAAEPLTLMVRAHLAAPEAQPVLPRGVPGTEPTDLPTVIRALEEQGILAPGNPDAAGGQHTPPT